MFGMVFSLTIGASLLDSLNPIAIAQQFILQSTSKNKHSIVGYILGIGSTNFLFGLLFYFGLAESIRNGFIFLIERYAILCSVFIFIAGVCLLLHCLHTILRRNGRATEQPVLRKRKTNLSFGQLFMIGVVSCLFELTSALPYISYLTLLISFNLDWMMVLVMLVLYNLVIFNLPLYALYIGSLLFEKKLALIYSYFDRGLSFITRSILPIIGIILSIGLFYVAIFYF